MISFIGIAYFATAIGSHNLGIYFLFLSLVGISGVFTNFGIRSAIEKRISGGMDADQILATGVLLLCLTHLLLVAIVFVLQDYINDYLGYSLALAIPAAVFGQELARLTNNVLRGTMDIQKTALVEFVRPVAWLIVSLFLVTRGYDVEALIAGYFAGILSMLLVGAWRAPLSVGKPTWQHARSITNFAKYSVVSAIGGRVFSWADVLVIGFFLTQSHVSAYEIAWRITAVVAMFGGSITTVMFPQISNWNANERYEQIREAVSESTSATFAVTIPALFGVYLLSEDILGTLFGSDYVIASVPLVILMVARVFQSAEAVFGRALSGLNKPNLATRTTIIAVVVNGSLNALLVWQFGIVGGAVATMLSILLKTGLDAIYLSNHITIKFDNNVTRYCIISSIGMSMVIVGVKNLAPLSTRLAVIATVVLGMISYLALLYRFDVMRTKIRGIAAQAW